MRQAAHEAIKQEIQIALANLDEPAKGLILAGMLSEYIDIALSERPKLSKREINSRITQYTVNTLMMMWPSKDILCEVIDGYCHEHPETERALKLLVQLSEHYGKQLKD